MTFELSTDSAGVVARLHGMPERYEDSLTYVAMISGTTVGDEFVGISRHAATQARMRNEPVDILVRGTTIATVMQDGSVR